MCTKSLQSCPTLCDPKDCIPPGSSVHVILQMRNAGLEEAQAGIKIARININNLRYAEDITLMAETEELKSLLIKMKEESEKLA